MKTNCLGPWQPDARFRLCQRWRLAQSHPFYSPMQIIKTCCKEKNQERPRMFFLKQIADCLLGEDSSALWLTEFYGDCELGLSKAALQKAQNYKTVACLDPFENCRMQIQKPDLILKPNSIDQAILMSQEMLKTKIINLVILDSLFWSHVFAG